VLVHCAAGVSRSASFVIAYLMRVEKMKYVDAYQSVKTKRQIIRPNSGFVKQLREYERGLAVGVKGYKKDELVIIDKFECR
jgi:protein-tyrosine phosphatase